MRLLPDPDATAFAASVADLLADAADAEALRAAWDGADGRVPGLWQRLADVGVTGLTVPEDYGGSGVGLTAVVPVLVEIGRAAVPEPLAQCVAGVALLAAAGGPVAADWLPRVASGAAVIAIGEDRPAIVAGGQWADLLLLADGPDIRAVERSAAGVTPLATLDRGIGLVEVEWTDTDGTLLAGGDGAAAYDTACVAVAAELVGLAAGLLDMSVGYAHAREQFGKPIGSFQAVKHLLADVFVDLAFARPVVHRAAWSVEQALPSRGRDSSHAILAAGRAAEHAARTALQVHAGIGYTYEHDLHRWMKRTWSLTSLWGGAHHRARVATAIFGADPPPRVP